MDRLMQLSHSSEHFSAPSLDDTALSPERRSATRQISVMLTAKLRAASWQQPCRIVNLSIKGAKIETLAELEVGETVLIEFRSDLEAAGRVRWKKAGQAGIEFDAPIELQAALRRSEIRIERIKPRPPRYRCEAAIIVESPHRRVYCGIVDISSTGLKIDCPLIAAAGHMVAIEIEGLPRHKAQVVWISAHASGLQLLNPFKFQELELWLLSHGRLDEAGE
jgi:hypothetical protein